MICFTLRALLSLGLLCLAWLGLSRLLLALWHGPNCFTQLTLRMLLGLLVRSAWLIYNALGLLARGARFARTDQNALLSYLICLFVLLCLAWVIG